MKKDRHVLFVCSIYLISPQVSYNFEYAKKAIFNRSISFWFAWPKFSFKLFVWSIRISTNLPQHQTTPPTIHLILRDPAGAPGPLLKITADHRNLLAPSALRQKCLAGTLALKIFGRWWVILSPFLNRCRALQSLSSTRVPWGSHWPHREAAGGQQSSRVKQGLAVRFENSPKQRQTLQQ